MSRPGALVRAVDVIPRRCCRRGRSGTDAGAIARRHAHARETGAQLSAHPGGGSGLAAPAREESSSELDNEAIRTGEHTFGRVRGDLVPALHLRRREARGWSAYRSIRAGFIGANACSRRILLERATSGEGSRWNTSASTSSRRHTPALRRVCGASSVRRSRPGGFRSCRCFRWSAGSRPVAALAGRSSRSAARAGWGAWASAGHRGSGRDWWR